MQVNYVEAFSDNYIWIAEQGNQVAIVDPGESAEVLRYVEEKQKEVIAILLTHKHDDHIGGVKAIVEKYPNVIVFGPKETKQLADRVIQDGDSFDLLGHQFNVFKTAGHSEEHISYLTEDKLFCGDALFSGGCGRVFTGDYQAQYDALKLFNQLDDEVHVFAGHEYTQTNLRFALSIEPDNTVISKALEEANQLREENIPTLPSTIGKEKAINLFLQAESVEKFTELRNARDNF